MEDKEQDLRLQGGGALPAGVSKNVCIAVASVNCKHLSVVALDEGKKRVEKEKEKKKKERKNN